MPTKDRLRFVPRAIRCFQQQTYPNKELLILDDGRQGLPELIPNDPQIRYARTARVASLGWKRNLACEMSRGEYIAHWDDDDWSSAARLAAQLGSAVTVTGLRRMLFWDERRASAWIYTGSPRYVLGTSLLYRRDWWEKNKFENIDVGEDNRFHRKAGKDLLVMDGLGLMVATNHGAGTAPRMMGPKWNAVDKAEIPEDYWQL